MALAPAALSCSIVSQNRFSWLTMCSATWRVSWVSGRMVGCSTPGKSATMASILSFGACSMMYLDSRACDTP